VQRDTIQYDRLNAPRNRTKLDRGIEIRFHTVVERNVMFFTTEQLEIGLSMRAVRVKVKNLGVIVLVKSTDLTKE